jgi:hypothetical protein
LTAETIPQGRELIGAWLDEGSGFVTVRVGLYRQDGKLFLEQTHKDGSSANGMMFLRQLAAGLHELHAGKPQALLLEALDDRAGETALDTVGF